MKYVILKHKSGVLMPVIFPQHITHSMVSIKECKAINAGFWKLENGSVVTYGESESLGLGRSDKDAALIQATLLNMGIYAFFNIR